MDAIRLVVCSVLAVPSGFVVDASIDRFRIDRPLFVPSERPRFTVRLVGAIVGSVMLFMIAAVRFADANWIEMLTYCALFAVLLALSLIDIAEHRLPDAIVIPSIVVGIALVVGSSFVDADPDRIRFALVGAAVAFGVLLVAHLVSPRGMGFGDVKLAVLLGLAVGWQASTVADSLLLVLWMLLFGFGVGTVAGLTLLVVRGRNRPFPFGPFLAIGTVLTIVLSSRLLAP